MESLTLPVQSQVKRRSSIEVKLDVLKAVSLGLGSPTRIMYASNTSWNTLKSILEEFLRKGLIEESGGGRRKYKITERGRDILRKYEEAIKALR